MTALDVQVHIAVGDWSAHHFPGDPLVPGAVLLDEIARALRLACAGLGMLVRVDQARFLLPVRPPATLHVHAVRRGANLEFTATEVGGATPNVQGRLGFA